MRVLLTLPETPLWNNPCLSSPATWPRASSHQPWCQAQPPSDPAPCRTTASSASLQNCQPGQTHSPPLSRGVTRSRVMRSREIKLDNISRHVKNLSHENCELSKLLFVTCGGSNAPLLRLACQNLKKEKEKKKRRSSRGSCQNEVGK